MPTKNRDGDDGRALPGTVADVYGNGVKNVQQPKCKWIDFVLYKRIFDQDKLFVPEQKQRHVM